MRLIAFVAVIAAVAMLIDPAWPGYRDRAGHATPGSVPGGIILPPFCAGPTQVQGVAAYVCEVPVNWVYSESELAQFASPQIGVTIQAVGGRGGDGGSSLGGTLRAGSGGDPVLAQTTFRGDALTNQALHTYVANNGSIGVASKGGNGGAATVVATHVMSPKPTTTETNSILVAAGGGGGGQGYASANQSFACDINVACNGGKGGVAIAIDEQNRFGTRLSDQLPKGGGLDDDIYNWANGQPPTFNEGVWQGGATSKGANGATGIAGSGAVSFAGAPATGSLTAGTWVRENGALTLGDPVVEGGNGAGRGGGGGRVAVVRALRSAAATASMCKIPLRCPAKVKAFARRTGCRRPTLTSRWW